MRFFSNEAKDNTDDQDVRTDGVPEQRPGSPWDDRPGASARPVQDPAPQPTAFGAGTPGGAVAASAAAGPHGVSEWERPRDTDAASGVADDRSVAPGDGVIEDRSVAPDDAVDDPARRDEAAAWASGDSPADRDRDAADRDAAGRGRDAADRDTVDHDVDVPLDDRADDTVDRDRPEAAGAVEDRGTFDDPHVVADGDRAVADEDRAVADGDRVGADEDRDASSDPRVAADGDRDAFGDSPVAAEEGRGALGDPRVEGEERTGEVAEDLDNRDDRRAVDESTEPVAVVDPEPVVAVAAVPEPATTAAPTGPVAIFPESQSQPLRDHWRDIQLRFVDDPKASTAEAAALVDETIEKLTTALRQHRGSLAGGGDDTEALRVELRSYRDILDRLLGL